MSDPTDLGGEAGLSELLGEAVLSDMAELFGDGDIDADLDFSELVRSDLLGGVDGFREVDVDPVSYTNELIAEYGDLSSAAGTMPGDNALQFIDTVMNASPEQLDHIAALEQSMTGHQAVMDVESPVELQAEFAEQDRIANHEFLEWQRHEAALADAQEEAARAAALESDVRRDLGIGD